MPEMNLAAVIADARAGQSYAMQQLYERYAQPIYRFCYKRLGDIEAAQDAMHDVFVQVWRTITTIEYRGEAAFMAWLYTIANNMVINVFRKRKKVQHVALEEAESRIASSDPARAVIDHVALQEAIAQLTADQQQVIALKFFGGLSNAEIGDVLGRNEGAVKALQHRALTRLSKILEGGAEASANFNVAHGAYA